MLRDSVVFSSLGGLGLHLSGGGGLGYNLLGVVGCSGDKEEFVHFSLRNTKDRMSQINSNNLYNNNIYIALYVKVLKRFTIE